MSKPYLLKCSLFLSVLALTTTTTRFAQANSDVTNQTPVASQSSADSDQQATGATAAQSDTAPADPKTPTQASGSPATTADPSSSPSNQAAAPVASPDPVVSPIPAAAPVDPSPVIPVEGQTVDIRILSTTDLHTNLVNYDYYQDKPSETIGLAKTALLIEEAKKEVPNVVLVDNGDTIQGTPLGTYKAVVDPIEVGEQHPMYKALQALGFDASTLGNHEFNYGLDYLNKLIASAGLPLVNANVRDAKTNELLYTPYIILPKTFVAKDGQAVKVNVGITGITPPQILSWDKAHLEGKILVQDSVEAVEAIIPKMRQAGADVVLVLSHSGIGDDKYEKGEENVGYQIASLDGVDAVVTGHSHAEFPSGKGTGFYEKYKGVDGVKGTINGKPVTMGGKYGDHLGVIDLNLVYRNGKWGVADSSASIRKIDTKSSQADQRILDIAREAHEATINYVRQKVGTSTAPITSYFALVQDDPSIQIVNNAQLWYGKTALAGTPEAKLPLLSAAAPFKAGTRGDATAYTDIPAGPIAIKNVADLYLYDNVTAVLKVTGAQLKEWLEMSAGQFKQVDPHKKEAQQIINTDYRTYNFDVIDGVTYEIDITQPNKYDREGKLVNSQANRILNLSYGGQAVDPNQEFMVVTNNYRASGKFPGVRDASLNYLLGLENRQVIINYIIEQGQINPTADQNWRFADTIKDLDLRFLTADKAKQLIANDPQISYLAPSATSDGFGEYRFLYAAPSTTPGQTGSVPGLTPPLASGQQNPLIQLSHHQVVLPQGKTGDGQALDPSKTQQASHLQVVQHLRQQRQASKATLPQTGSQTNAFVQVLGLVLASVVAGLGLSEKGKKTPKERG